MDLDDEELRETKKLHKCEERKGNVEGVEKDLKAKSKNAEKVFNKLTKKLLCNYEVFKRERTKCNMNVPEKCENCHRPFKDKDSIHLILENTEEVKIVCDNCATTGKRI